MRLYSIGTVIIFSVMVSNMAFASGLDDLKTALKALPGTTPIHASLHQEVVETKGEDDELEVEEGLVNIALQDGSQGLQVTYSNTVMALLEQESQRKVANEDADTPTSMAVSSINTGEMRSMLSAASAIERRLAKAEFIEELPIERDGRQLRLLEFTMPLESIIDDKRTREYVKKFKSSYSVIIDENGFPLESKLSFHGKGRAYVVLRVEASGEGTSKYTVVGDRLVRIQNKFINRYDSTFGEGSFTETQYLTLVPENAIAAAQMAAMEK